MNQSTVIAVILALGLTIWMASGQFAETQEPQATVEDKVAKSNIKVQVATLQAQTMRREVIVQGQLEPRRILQIQAETAGKVIKLPIAKGTRVKTKTVIAQLAMDNRQARLTEAQALLRHQEKNAQAIGQLKKRGLQAENKYIEAQAAVASAKATLAQIQLDIKYTKIRAPFAAVLNERPIELGTFVQRGDVVATLVDDNTLLISGQVPQSQIYRLHIGQAAQARLANGQEVTGKVIYLSSVAEASTRSFRVEVEVPNPAHKLVAGMSATLHIPLEETAGHFISPAMLALSDSGTLGIKAVDEGNQVVFYPIEILRSEARGVWVTGLPETVRLITLGQGFVSAGEVVDAQPQAQATAVNE